jgi:hypothetical protein
MVSQPSCLLASASKVKIEDSVNLTPLDGDTVIQTVKTASPMQESGLCFSDQDVPLKKTAKEFCAYKPPLKGPQQRFSNSAK